MGSSPWLIPAALAVLLAVWLAGERRRERARDSGPAAAARARHPAGKKTAPHPRGQVTSHAMEEAPLTLDEEDAWRGITGRLGARGGNRG